MLVEQRYHMILDLMKQSGTGSVQVSELKKRLSVSSETIRPDLENMENQGLIRRIRGGAFLNEETDPENGNNRCQPFGIRGLEHMESKNEIAEFTITFI